MLCLHCEVVCGSQESPALRLEKHGNSRDLHTFSPKSATGQWHLINMVFDFVLGRTDFYQHKTKWKALVCVVHCIVKLLPYLSYELVWSSAKSSCGVRFCFSCTCVRRITGFVCLILCAFERRMGTQSIHFFTLSLSLCPSLFLSQSLSLSNVCVCVYEGDVSPLLASLPKTKTHHQVPKPKCFRTLSGHFSSSSASTSGHKQKPYSGTYHARCVLLMSADRCKAF